MTIKGIVLSQKPFREQDKFIDILTEHGIVETVVRGSAKVTSKNGSASQLFAYSQFDLSERHTKTVTSATPIHIFYELRSDLKAVALASYFAQVILYSALPETGTKEILRLMLNCLSKLSEPKHDEKLIKAIFELRLSAQLGFPPDVLMCRKCGEYLPEQLYFSPEKGCFFCADCQQEGILMPAGTLQAIRHITLQDFEKLFSFRLAEHCKGALFSFAEQFLHYHLDRDFPALDYYYKL